MKIGDRVKCIAKGRSFCLKLSVVYVVSGFLGNGLENSELICLEGVNGWFSQDSFEIQ